MTPNDTADVTGRMGMFLFGVGGSIVFLLESFGPGIDRWVIVGFGVVTVGTIVAAGLSTRLRWGAAIPVALLTGVLSAVYLMEPESGTTTYTYEVMGALFTAIGIFYFIGMPGAKSVWAIGRKIRQRW